MAPSRAGNAASGVSGPMLTPSEFAMVTGMTRDRLRTWERRYGWPQPERAGGGPRRYRTEDVATVVAVRRLHETGMPLGLAIDEQAAAADTPVGAGTWRQIVDALPLPVVVLSGPVPLRIEHVNVMLRERAGGPAAGETLEARAPWFSGAPATRLRAAFAGGEQAARVEHPDWTGGLARMSTSLAVRVPQASRSLPLLTLLGTSDGLERRLVGERAHHRRERARLQADAADVGAWTATARDVARATAQPGLRGLRAGLQALRRRTGAGDVAAYLSDGSTFRMYTCLRGRFHPVSGLSAGALAQSAWLDPRAAARLGAPAGYGLTISSAAEGAPRPLAVALAAPEPIGLATAERDLLDLCVEQLARAIVAG